MVNNYVLLIGFAADEPFVRSTEFGRLARLRIATVEHLKSERTGKLRENIEWHTILAYGESAILIDREVKIGTPLRIEGALRGREWQDRNGTTQKAVEIAASKIEILDSIEGCKLPKQISERVTTTEPKSAVPSPRYEIKAPAEDPDGLPF